MKWKPNKWIAAALSIFAMPLGMLYVDRPRLYFVYFAGLLASALLVAFVFRTSTAMPAFFTATAILFQIVSATHAYRIAARAPTRDSRPWTSRWYGLLAVVLCTFLALLSFRAFVAEPFRVPGQSMLPTIRAGAYVVVRKLGYGNYKTYGIRLLHTEISESLNRGDVLAFEWPSDRRQSLLKRLIGLPGDHIEYSDKHLYVNGQLISGEPVALEGDLEILREAGYQIAIQPSVPSTDFVTEVQPGHLFFLGDNRDRSNDSRYWGEVPFDHVIGKVVFVLGIES